MKGRAKRGLCIVALVACAAARAAAQHVPIFPQGEVELQGRAQLVAEIGSWDVLAELLGRLWDESTPLHSLESVTLGGYYRALANLKIGALYRLQAGARHNDDVIANISTNQWDWNDTSGRLESLLMLDASPRFLLDFLPGRDWVFMLKGRLIYNASYQNQMSLMARPELTWFWIQDRVPVLNVSLSYELYFPLNFPSSFIYESYPYLTLLYHATPEIGIELAGAYKTTVWSTSASWAAAGWDSYSTPVSSWLFSLGVVYTPSF